MKETNIDLMDELVADGVGILKELFNEEIKPLIQKRKEMEHKIANKEISEMHRMEQEV